MIYLLKVKCETFPKVSRNIFEKEKIKMGLAITGQVTGKILAGAMIRAQTVTPGDLIQKQAAGVGFFNQYLNLNSAGSTAWQIATCLSPKQVVARASLNSSWLEEAGRLIGTATDCHIRAGLLGQIIKPHLQMPALAHLFGDEIGQLAQKFQEIKIEEISHLLKPQFPAIELEMCSIPGGKFPMGSSKNANEKFTDEKQHLVTLSAFNIGTYEVTVAQYQKYLEQTGVSQPAYWDDPRFGKEKPSHPVVGVNWHESMAFAEWLGMRLPTEAEGEFAARAYNPDKNGVYKCREYPFGDILDLSKVTFNTDGTRPVNAHPGGKSHFGVWDMSGNVWEWRKDWYDGKGYNPEDLINPQGPNNGTSRVLRGGSWYNNFFDCLRSAGRIRILPAESSSMLIGFRVATDLK
jgi:formylglycine-generating enzyme required for sulfatase activity